VVGAYTKEKAMENLPKLFAIANKFPDRTIVAAAGNFGDDLREAMQVLQADVPPNLLIISEWVDQSGPYGDVYGAMLAVDNANNELPDGSSFATGYVSSIAAELNDAGMAPADIVAAIKNAYMDETFNIDENTKEQQRVFDRYRIKTADK
jgi:hypothetical protein